jgi:hypothetical protein
MCEYIQIEAIRLFWTEVLTFFLFLFQPKNGAPDIKNEAPDACFKKQTCFDGPAKKLSFWKSWQFILLEQLTSQNFSTKKLISQFSHLF